LTGSKIDILKWAPMSDHDGFREYLRSRWRLKTVRAHLHEFQGRYLSSKATYRET